ncbi:MAG TPA: DUF2442 domain-containing protein [Patescibacteria group bacterium]|nr:DUF2442 domain-containing protein [Patescibacteria group bacterium]
MNIAEIVPKEDHLLYIKADDGQTGLFDVTPYLKSEAFAPLKDRSAFERIHNRGTLSNGSVGQTFLQIPFRRGGCLRQVKAPNKLFKSLHWRSSTGWSQGDDHDTEGGS